MLANPIALELLRPDYLSFLLIHHSALDPLLAFLFLACCSSPFFFLLAFFSRFLSSCYAFLPFFLVLLALIELAVIKLAMIKLAITFAIGLLLLATHQDKKTDCTVASTLRLRISAS
ncbi:hypothetical protein Tco_1423098 [Tanacetum coccineum]